MKTLMIILLSVFLVGCETTKTGLVGDIPAGMKTWGQLNEGQVYIDTQHRFKVTVPYNDLLLKKRSDGVVLLGKYHERGDFSFGILIYDLPSNAAESSATLVQMVNTVTQSIERKWPKYRVDIVSQQELFVGGFWARNANFKVYEPGSSSDPKAIYLSRFIIVGKKIYYLYYYIGGFRPKYFNSSATTTAEKFFANVNLGGY